MIITIITAPYYTDVYAVSFPRDCRVTSFLTMTIWFVIPSVAWESPGKAPCHTDVYADSLPGDSHVATLLAMTIIYPYLADRQISLDEVKYHFGVCQNITFCEKQKI